MTTVLHTARLDLVLLEPETARALATGTNPDGSTWGPGYPLAASLLYAELTTAAADGGRPLGPFGTYQVVRRADGEVIGDAGFLGPPDATGAVHLAIVITEPARRRGYATEAVSALLEWARTQDGLTCVLADTTRTNRAAQRLLERVGMQPVGRDDQLLYYMA
ncbi:MAG TPA: GNAT family N-acetyltransferase [Solirubrobacteraceae bacterium]|nr:GNAT family N-acetyltransferase [Solirubrobacteraceae bacterium]